MIATLKGNIELLRDTYVILDVGGVGYKIFVSPYTMGKLAGTGSALLYTHTYVREDSLALYGFMSLEELEMFEMLISISGIGPKAGLGILSIADPRTIRTAIANEDSSILTKVSGVGKKTAERVILELRSKIGQLPAHEKHEVSADADALDALMAMGYPVTQAREALKHVPAEITDAAKRVTAALKILGRK